MRQRQGRTTLNAILRKEVEYWSKHIREAERYRCIITGKSTGVTVHHSSSFSKLRDQVLESLGLSYHPYADQYAKAELGAILVAFRKKHYKLKGYVIKKALHREFHDTYGPDATEEDFQAFLFQKTKERSAFYDL